MLPPDSAASIRMLGHREWVGGMWEEIGKLQLDFLVAQGLKPDHALLDIACGSLRGGRYFIPYLGAGNYLGIDKHKALIDDALRTEVAPDIVRTKKPEFVISDRFEFSRLSKQPDICIAHAIFTQLNAADIKLCLARLAAFVRPGCRLYATFFERGRQPGLAMLTSLLPSHSLRPFCYRRSTIMRLGDATGWRARYIGDWGHPRGHKMIEFTHDG
jgi:SAM-dependent methyltransferase